MKYILASLLLLLLVGCGAESENAGSAVVSVEMQQNVSYSVHKGDELKKTSPDAKISIVKNLGDERTTMVLLEGSAQIIRAE